MSKSIFELNAGSSEREAELRRMNEAFRECRLAWQARLAQEHAPEKQADNVVTIAFVNRSRGR